MVRREVESRTIDTILTHPVSRPAFILGKFAGFYATVLLCLGALSVMWLAVVALFGGGITSAILITPALSALEALVVTSVAILFSAVASPLLSAVFTVLVFVAGHVAYDVKRLAELSESRARETAPNVVYAGLPSLLHFDTRNNLLTGVPVPTEQLVGCVAYALLYSAALLALTIFAFGRRDFE
jgi:ABC-type transport system involved in multi-copper enzyme maturation permease subunit